MSNWHDERMEKLRDFFGLDAGRALVAEDTAQKFEVSPEVDEGLRHFNIEWHVVPAAEAVPLDDDYFARLYPLAPRDFTKTREHGHSYREQLAAGHARLQGRIVGVETTRKPHYLPGNRQFYGTAYGHDATADPLAAYMGRAGMMNGTRYAHNYLSLRAFLSVVNEDWGARRLLPAGYRATVCPPAVCNLVGTIFHPEWSDTETLELGFYRDEQGNATCFAVGSNAPGDYSFINEVEGEDEWSLMGFRLALVPE
ncbi:MAG: hypothetical protein QOG71_1801 [Pyrinomonadaceae bacterium]|nr:hypothetical protein [Pyrinomonadaceae bacterium]